MTWNRFTQIARWALTIAAITATTSAGPAAAATILYGAAGEGTLTSTLVVIDPATGSVATTIGDIGFGLTGLGMNPITGAIYGVTSGLDADANRLLVSI